VEKYINFEVETDADGIALVTWDMPGRSMNVFTHEVMTELDRIVDQVVSDAAIKGAVIASGKDSFSAGADLSMLSDMMVEFAKRKATDYGKAIEFLFENAGYMTKVNRKLETSGKPWVAAVNGICMGGAFELALASHIKRHHASFDSDQAPRYIGEPGCNLTA
jgi:3-hydroxyacyl-CoA dehydrogenase / enoyl-CoA hydratase / 3-hydroxybutyryl-CoA epimerase